MINHCIDLDTPEACEIGFTSDKFDGYLWRRDNHITISAILSRQPGQGNLSRLFDAILAKGLDVKVPNPLPRMEQIGKNKGFTRTQEPFEPGIIDDLIDVYVLKAEESKEPE